MVANTATIAHKPNIMPTDTSLKITERLRDVFLLLPLVFGLESDFLRGPGPANTGSCRRGPRRFCFFLPNPNTRIKSPKIYRQYLVTKPGFAVITITMSQWAPGPDRPISPFLPQMAGP